MPYQELNPETSNYEEKIGSYDRNYEKGSSKIYIIAPLIFIVIAVIINVYGYFKGWHF